MVAEARCCAVGPAGAGAAAGVGAEAYVAGAAEGSMRDAASDFARASS